MRKVLRTAVIAVMAVMAFSVCAWGASITIDAANFPDDTFREYVSSNFDTDNDGSLIDSEIEAATTIEVSDMNITSLKGIEYLTALDRLVCDNNQLTELDVSNNTVLSFLGFSHNQITAIDLSNNRNLVILGCEDNLLTELDVSNNTLLETLDIYENKITALDVSRNTALTYLQCSNNQITSLDVTKNTELTSLYFNYNQIKELDVSNNSALTELVFEGNQITELNLSNNIDLTALCFNGNQLKELDLSANTALTSLQCGGNQLTELDVSNNTNLTELQCFSNKLSALDLSVNTSLVSVDTGTQNIEIPGIESSDIASYPYSLKLSSVSGFDLSRVSNLKAMLSGDTEISSYMDSSNGTVYLASYPEYLTYNYDTGNSTAQYMSVTASIADTQESGSGIPDGIVGMPYSYQLESAMSGDATWSIVGGELPPGLMLSSSGMISGTPTQAGTYTADINVNGDSSETRTLTITIRGDSDTGSDDLPSPAGSDSNTLYATVGMPYSYQLESAMSGDVTWSIVGGELPPGLMLSSSGMISGTPIQAGTYTADINVNGDSSETRTLTITIRSTVSDSEDISPSDPSDGSNTDKDTSSNTSGDIGGNTGGGNSGGNTGNGTGSNTGNNTNTGSGSGSNTGGNAENDDRSNTNTDTSNDANTDTGSDNSTPTESDTRANTIAERYSFNMSSAMMNRVLSVFPRASEGSVYQLSGSEIVSDTWTISDSDAQELAELNEEAVMNIPAIRAENTGVYVLKLTLSAIEAGTKIMLHAVSAVSDGGGSVSASALEDVQYKFLDEDGNEIDTVPESGAVYAAMQLTAGTETRGVITVPSSRNRPAPLAQGTVVPIVFETEEEQEELITNIVEALSETVSIDAEEIKFITEENITPAPEPTREMVNEAKNNDHDLIGKLSTIEVEEEGWYVIKIELSNDLFEQVDGVDINDVAMYAFSADVTASDNNTYTVRSSLFMINGLLGTWELLTVSGQKFDKFGFREFLMVGFLNAGQPFTLYLAKTILALVTGGLGAGCSAGLGLSGAAGALAAIIFIGLRKRR